MMLTINSALGIVVILVGFMLFMSIAMSVYASRLLNRSIEVLIAVYDLVEIVRDTHGEYKHEGTE